MPKFYIFVLHLKIENYEIWIADNSKKIAKIEVEEEAEFYANLL